MGMSEALLVVYAVALLVVPAFYGADKKWACHWS